MYRVSWVLLCAGLLPAADPRPLLWRDPGDVARLDFAAGPGTRGLRPVAPFRFLREMTGGTSPKVEVRDARGLTWRVKFGGEVHADVFSSRIAWACGYYADPIFYIPGGVIEGAPRLNRGHRALKGDGRFSKASFE